MALGLTLAGCGGPPQPDSTPGTLPSHPRSPTAPAATEPFATQADLVLGLAGEPGNWNPLAAPQDDSPALAAVVQAVLPSTFVPGPGPVPIRDEALVTAATATTTGGTQTITYRINPRATWSDGVAITEADFAYTWEAQSGRARYHDLGGAAFTPATTAGYRQVTSVAAPPHDPDEVVVRLASPDPDWRSLFAPILPAHVARRVGFDHGFTDPVTSLVSGGPFLVQSYQPGRDVLLVRNPRWWGEVANLAAIDVTFVDSTAVATQALEQGQLGAAVTAYSPAGVAALDTVPGLTITVSSGPDYDDLIFNERSGPLSVRAVRLAVMLAVDRAALAHEATEGGDTSAAVVANRTFEPGEAGYDADDGVLGHETTGAPVQARRLLAAAGFALHGSTLLRAGRPVRLTLAVDTGSPLAADETAAVVSACRTLGIALTTVGSSAVPASRRATGRAALALVEVPVTSSPDALEATYGTFGSANRSGYASTVMDGLLAQLASARSTALRDELTDQVDSLAWTDAVDLPLLAVPRVLAYQSRYVNLTATTSTLGIGGGMARWGIPQAP